MSKTKTTIKAGNNYLAHRSAQDFERSADVLHVGNGFVVYNERLQYHTGRAKITLKVATEITFRRSYSLTEGVIGLIGKRITKPTILRTLPDAARAY